MSSIVERNRGPQRATASLFRTWQFFFFLLACACGTVGLKAQPANDNFTNAIVIGGGTGTVIGSTEGASVEAGEPAHLPPAATSNSVWYSWTALATGIAEFNTEGSPPTSDTVLAVYTGTNVGGLSLVVNDDDSGFTLFASRVLFTAIAGTTYHIAVDGWNGASGGFILNWLAQSNSIPVNTNEIQFAATNFIGFENLGYAEVVINYGGGAVGDVTVDLITSDGTALDGTNYADSSQTVIFTNGQTVAVVEILLYDDNFQNPDRTVNLSLSNPTGGANLGAVTNSVLTIRDNETPAFVSAAGTFNFSSGLYTVHQFETVRSGLAPVQPSPAFESISQSAFGALVTVTRTGGSSGKVMVDAVVSTAAGGVISTNTLVFDDYQMSASFLVPVSLPGTINLSLANPRADLLEDPVTIAPTLGFQSTALIQVLQVLAPGNTYSFERRWYRMTEFNRENVTAPTNYIFIDILNPSGAAGSVVFELRNLYGFLLAAGSDYTDAGLRLTPNPLYTDGSLDITNYPDYFGLVDGNGFSTALTVGFNQNQFRRAIKLVITNDNVVEFNEDILMILRNPDPNHSVLNGTANLTIMDDDQPAGAVDREWNPEFVSFTQPPFYTTPGANNTVLAVASTEDNRTILAGEFTAVNSVSRFRIARMLPNGALDLGFNPGSGANGFVEALALYRTNVVNGTNSGKILIGGGFTTLNNIPRVRIARLNWDGSLDNSFNPGNGFDGPVHTIALQSDGRILVTGDFVHYNDIPVPNIVRLNQDGSLDISFNAGAGANGTIRSVSVRDAAQTIFAPRAAAGTELEDVNVIETGSTEGTVTIDYDFLAIPDDIRVYYEGVELLNLFTNGFGQLVVPYGPGLATTVTIVMNKGIGISGTLWSYKAFVTPVIRERTIYVGGEFTGFDGVMRNGVARLRDDGTLDPSFDPGLGVDGPVYAVAIQPDNRLLVGGAFHRFHTSTRNSIVRLLRDGQLDESYNVGVGADGTIFSITLQPDNKALIGGTFNSYNGTRRMGLARLFLSGSLDTSFLDSGYNQFAGLLKTYSFDPPRFVKSIALQNDGNVLIGGSFTNLGGNFSLGHFLRNNYTYFTRADKATRYNVARLIGGYTPGPGNIEYDPTAFPFTIDENSGTFYATMRRVDGRLGTAQVIATNFVNTAVPPGDFLQQGVPQIWPEFAYAAPISVGYVGLNYFGIPIFDDMFQEGDEAFGVGAIVPTGSITLGGEFIPLGAALSRVDRSTVTVSDNDFSHGEFNFNTSLYYTNEHSGYAVITVIRTNGSSGAVSVDYFTLPGSITPATPGDDYTSQRDTLSFGSGETVKTFRVPIVNDSDVEFDETVTLVLSNALGGAQLPGGTPTSIATSTLRIVDNDFLAGRINFQVETFTNSENELIATIAVSRTGGNVGAMSVQARTVAGGSATEGEDYTGTTNTLTWADGDSTTKTFTFPLFTDGMVEGDETVNLELFDPSVPGALGAGTNAVLVIADSDRYGALSFSQPSYSAQENGTSPSITIVRSGGIAGTVSVVAVTASLTAAPGTDYNDVTNVLTFLPGEISKSFTVPLLDDPSPDGNKLVQLSLVNPTNASLGAFTNVTLTIIDNEAANVPAGTVDSGFSSEAQTDAAVYALALQPDGRILMAGDFSQVNHVPRNRIARLQASGDLDTSFDIGIGTDAAIRALALQPNGRLLIGGLFSTVSGTNRSGIARLQTDGSLDAFFDPGAGADNPVFAITLQGDDKVLAGGSFSTFDGINRPGIVRLHTNGAVDLTFDVGAGIDGTVFAIALQADGKILVGGDFISFDGESRTNLIRLNTDGSLDTAFHPTFGTNAAVRAIVVQPDGTIVIGGSFTNVNNATRNYIARLNDDGTLDSTFQNGLPGADFAVFALAQQVDGKIVAVGDFRRFNGVTRNGITRLNSDGTTDPTINFGNGANAFVAAVVIQPDEKIVIGGGFTEFNDLPRLHIARIYGGSIAGSGTITFNTSVFRVPESSTNAQIIITRLGGTTGEVRADAFTRTNGTARLGIDYLAASNTVIFPEGETRQVINVPIIPNVTPDGNRTVGLGLANFVGAVAGPDPVATLVIEDDEAIVRFSNPTYGFSENVFSGNATIPVLREGATNTLVTVQIATVAGSATPGLDYIETNSTLTFVPGEVVKLFNVRLLDDALIEGASESVLLTLRNPSGTTTLGTSNATLNILDNDFGPGQFLFATNNFGVDETGGPASITIIRTNGITGIASVRLTTSNGSATAGVDYVPTNLVVAFGDGVTAVTVPLRILNDASAEPDETVLLTLSQPTGGASILSSNAVLTIFDDEILPSFVGFQTNNFFVNEPDGFATINIVRTNSRRGTVSVDFSVSNGSAIAGVDYFTTNGTMTFVDGETIKAFRIPIVNDIEGEGTETVRLSLSNVQGPGATISLPTSTLNILDDDTTLRFISTAFSVAENGGSAVITVERVGVTNTPVSVTYATTLGGTAIGGLDYVPVVGTLNWPANDGAPKTFTVPIIDNNVLNVSKTVFLVLSNAVGASAYVTAPTNAILTIVENETVAPVAGPVDPIFNANYGANDSVRSISYDASGRLYVGGDFTQFHGLHVNRITRLTTNTAVDIAFNVGAGADATVYSVAALPSGAYVAGAFTNINGVARSRVARLLGNGTLDLAFNPTNGAADGTVYAVAVAPDQKVLIGGEFLNFDGNPSRHVARLNPDGSFDGTFNVGSGVDGFVHAVAVQPNGQVVIGGEFTVVGGFLVTRIARLNSDGSLDTTFAVGLGADGTVNSIAIAPDGKIVIGGAFHTVNGVPREGVARLNIDGSVDTAFDTGTGANAPVLGVAVELDGHVLVAGAFTAFNGNPLRGIARLNTDGGLDPTFTPGTGADAPVRSVGVVPRQLPPSLATMTFDSLAPDSAPYATYTQNSLTLRGVIGGTFFAVSNPPFATGARINFANSPQELTFAGGFSFNLVSVYFTNVTAALPVLVTASSGAATLVTTNGLYFFDGSFIGATWVRFDATGTNVIDNITVVAGPDAFRTPFFAIGGDFEKFNEVQHGGVAVLTTSGEAARNDGPRHISTRSVFATAIYTNVNQPSLIGKIVAGGDFTALVGVDGINRIGRLNIDGTLDTSFNSGLGANGPVRAVAVQPDGKIVFGGFFTTYDLLSRAYLARANVDGSLDNSFNFGAGLNNAVLAIAQQPNGRFIIGGAFTTVYGVSRNSIARVHTNGTVDVTFNPGSGANGLVKAVALQADGKVVIGGDFTVVNGQPRARVARLNANGSVDTTFDPGSGADGSVNAIALTSSGGVLIGGAFTNVNGVLTPRLALLTSSGAVDGSFDAGSGPNDYVTSIQVQPDGHIIVGGNFTAVDGQVRNRIVRLEGNGALDATINFGTGANDVINTVSLQDYDGKIVIGGSFTEVDGLARVAIARLISGTNSGSGTFRFSSPTFTVNEDDGTATLTVLRSGGTVGPASISYSAVNGTATSPGDYSAVSGTLDFGNAENVKYITVPITDNGSVDGDRNFSVTLFSPTGGADLGAPSNAVVTIVDNDSVIAFSSVNYSAIENAGVARITVTRMGGASDVATVSFFTADGTATTGLDYAAVAGTLTFAPGVRLQTFDVPLVDDLLNEFNETVSLHLTNATGATLGQASATLTIQENDFASGIITFGTNSYFAAEEGGVTAIEVLRLNGFSGPVTVAYRTVNNGTALVGVDYASTNGTVNFADGQTNAFIYVRLIDDLLTEGNETVPLELLAPSSGAGLGLANATLNIVDNDLPGTFVFSSTLYVTSESNAFARITVLRTNGNRGQVSVTLSANGGTATPSVDYAAFSTVLDFADGETFRTFDIQVFQDIAVEGTETISLLLSNPQPPGGSTNGAAIGTPGVATLQINDDEVGVGFSLANYSVNEVDGTAVITVIRTGDTNGAFFVAANTSDASAVGGADYSPTSIVLSFAPGVITQTFNVTIIDDQLAEGNEALNLTLSSPSGGVALGPIATATLTILDNDVGYNFSSATYATNEAFVTMVITVLRTGFQGATSSVDFATSDGTAISGLDYQANQGTLVFGLGQTSATFTVFIFGDFVVENNETVLLSLANPSPGTFLGPQSTAVLSILDDDTSVGFSQLEYVTHEQTNALITLVRRGAATQPVSVTFSTLNGSALAPADYTAVNVTVTWAANDVAPKTIPIAIVPDGIPEGSETVNLQLSNPVGAFIDPASAPAVLRIVDNAGVIAFASASYTVIEGNVNALINLVRTGGSNGVVSVNWGITGGSATPGEDYSGSAGTVVFASNEVVKPILLPILEDGSTEGVESVVLTLTTASGGARVGNPSTAVLSITDNDAGIIVGAGSALSAESYIPTNNVIEPGETVTVLFALRNAGVVNADNVTAFLVYSNGVTHSTPQVQNYGALIAGGNSESRPFTFTAIGTNGSRITATLLITNNGLFLGPVSFEFVLGRQNILFQNASAITIRDYTTASPYPAQLAVSGVGGALEGLRVTLHGVTHNFPDDIDMLLVAPNGTAVMLMSDAGAAFAAGALNNVTFTFDDNALQVIPDNGRITNGLSYRCANYDVLTDPFDAFPGVNRWTNTLLSSLIGINPNGVWSLYIQDDGEGQSGTIANGWSLSIQTSGLVIPGADLSVTVTDAPDPVVVGGTVVYTIGVTNHGPGAANSVMLTNVLPPEANFIAASGPFSYSQNGNLLFGSLGNLAIGSGVAITVTMNVPNSPALLTFDSAVGSGAADVNMGNNQTSIKTSVIGASTDTPPLFVARKNGELVLSWQGTTTNVFLEASGALGIGWANSGMTPVVSNGVSTVTVPLSGGSKFFRLKRVP